MAIYCGSCYKDPHAGCIHPDVCDCKCWAGGSDMKNPRRKNNKRKKKNMHWNYENDGVGTVTTSTPSTYKYDACTHGSTAKVAFKVGDCTILAGGADDIWRAQHEFKPDLLISVGGKMQYERATESVLDWHGKSLQHLPLTGGYYLRPHTPKYGSLVIDWPDFQAPPVQPEWWVKLAADLKGLKGTVAIFCMGGHGRTGTALAILAHHMGVAEAQMDPVEWIRKTYCGKAVESKSQLEYIKSCGIATDCGGSRETTYSANEGSKLGSRDTCFVDGCKLIGFWDSTWKDYTCDAHWKDDAACMAAAIAKKVKAQEPKCDVPGCNASLNHGGEHGPHDGEGNIKPYEAWTEAEWEALVAGMG